MRKNRLLKSDVLGECVCDGDEVSWYLYGWIGCRGQPWAAWKPEMQTEILVPSPRIRSFSSLTTLFTTVRTIGVSNHLHIEHCSSLSEPGKVSVPM